MQRHAYLILAHNDISQLRLLLSCIDDRRNDIFLHWDLKSGAIPTLNTTYSRLFILEKRIKVNWASFSIVEAELLLFKEAVKYGSYAYYHLLSGADLPIKSQDYIHTVCEKFQGTEFIAFAPASKDDINYRVQHRFLFSEEFRTRNPLKRCLRFLSLRFQDLIGFKRTCLIVKKGSQWCSISHPFVVYLLEKEDLIRQVFSNTFCPDEMFIQTIAFNSPFSQSIKQAETEFDGNMRFIKWINGQLIPITEEDFPQIENSDKWFARKFTSADYSLAVKVSQLCK